MFQKLPARQRRSTLVAVTLRPSEREQFDALADDREVSSSSLLRKMILRELRRSGRTVETAAGEG